MGRSEQGASTLGPSTVSRHSLLLQAARPLPPPGPPTCRRSACIFCRWGPYAAAASDRMSRQSEAIAVLSWLAATPWSIEPAIAPAAGAASLLVAGTWRAGGAPAGARSAAARRARRPAVARASKGLRPASCGHRREPSACASTRSAPSMSHRVAAPAAHLRDHCFEGNRCDVAHRLLLALDLGGPGTGGGWGGGGAHEGGDEGPAAAAQPRPRGALAAASEPRAARRRRRRAPGRAAPLLRHAAPAPTLPLPTLDVRSWMAAIAMSSFTFRTSRPRLVGRGGSGPGARAVAHGLGSRGARLAPGGAGRASCCAGGAVRGHHGARSAGPRACSCGGRRTRPRPLLLCTPRRSPSPARPRRRGPPTTRPCAAAGRARARAPRRRARRRARQSAPSRPAPPPPPLPPRLPINFNPRPPPHHFTARPEMSPEMSSSCTATAAHKRRSSSGSTRKLSLPSSASRSDVAM
jgi:hypothetical protein